MISLGIGDPDLPTPEPVVEALITAARDAATHQYPTNHGSQELREAAAGFYRDRFGVELDPVAEVVPALGGKEAVGHVALALLDPGDVALAPDPGYPPYTSGPLFAARAPLPAAHRGERLPAGPGRDSGGPRRASNTSTSTGTVRVAVASNVIIGISCRQVDLGANNESRPRQGLQVYGYPCPVHTSPGAQHARHSALSAPHQAAPPPSADERSQSPRLRSSAKWSPIPASGPPRRPTCSTARRRCLHTPIPRLDHDLAASPSLGFSFVSSTQGIVPVSCATHTQLRRQPRPGTSCSPPPSRGLPSSTNVPRRATPARSRRAVRNRVVVVDGLSATTLHRAPKCRSANQAFG